MAIVRGRDRRVRVGSVAVGEYALGLDGQVIRLDLTLDIPSALLLSLGLGPALASRCAKAAREAVEGVLDEEAERLALEDPQERERIAHIARIRAEAEAIEAQMRAEQTALEAKILGFGSQVRFSSRGLEFLRPDGWELAVFALPTPPDPPTRPDIERAQSLHAAIEARVSAALDAGRRINVLEVGTDAWALLGQPLIYTVDHPRELVTLAVRQVDRQTALSVYYDPEV
jgi:hypothetical protein